MSSRKPSRVSFDLPHGSNEVTGERGPDQYMDMIWHAVYLHDQTRMLLKSITNFFIQ